MSSGSIFTSATTVLGDKGGNLGDGDSVPILGERFGNLGDSSGAPEFNLMTETLAEVLPCPSAFSDGSSVTSASESSMPGTTGLPRPVETSDILDDSDTGWKSCSRQDSFSELLFSRRDLTYSRCPRSLSRTPEVLQQHYNLQYNFILFSTYDILLRSCE